MGRSFLAPARALIGVVFGLMKMRAHEKVDVFDVYIVMKLPVVNEELLSSSVIDLAMEAHYNSSRDPHERVLMGQEIFGDVSA